MSHFSIEKIILLNADNAARVQLSSGGFVADHNGPWDENVTPVRITAHWSIVLFYAYRIGGDPICLERAIKAIEFLCREEFRPGGDIFKCRNSVLKIKSNGLVGQAWACEALIEAYRSTGREKYIALASRTISAHFFDEKYFLWWDANLHSKKVRLNRTLNQQIFFSGIASKIASLTDDHLLGDICNAFWANINSRIRILDRGLPFHKIKFDRNSKVLTPISIRELMDRREWDVQSVGYAPFILYGFSLARIYNPDLDFFKQHESIRIISSIINYISLRYPYYCGSCPSSFNWAYNPTGIEMAVSLKAFPECAGTGVSRVKWLDAQFDQHMDQDGSLSKSTNDRLILSSRIYELTRLIDTRD